eukprot:7010687-Lingulodinium_polyedra.AAC.1
MKWARRYLPQGFPEGITLRAFNRPPDRGSWIYRYGGDRDLSRTYDESHDQKTCSCLSTASIGLGEALGAHGLRPRVAAVVGETRSGREVVGPTGF